MKEIIKEPVCFSCTYLIDYPYCEAFPDKKGIPDDIRNGENIHTLPVEGDNGIVYKKIKSREEEIQEMRASAEKRLGRKLFEDD
jgi:hypothetical protein